MTPDHPIVFPPFRLDPTDERLWRGRKSVPLTPRAYAVLNHLVRRAGRLVTKDDILRSIWRDTHVQDAVLKVCIREIRKALGDAARKPRFIETVHRRGYRFVGRIDRPAALTGTLRPHDGIVGRAAETGRLRGWFEAALMGERKVVFVTGEAGIGKSAVVDAFLAEVSAEPDLWLSRGTCLEQYGAGEAYLPVLEALARLARGARRRTLRALLRRHAPTWLVQLPQLADDADPGLLRREILGATNERMLREMAEAIEALTATTPLVLVLEDLHWSDYSTLDLIASLARRRETARLLLIGTYRHTDLALSHHPLRAVKQELQMRRQCHELPLGFLTESAVSEYLSCRFEASWLPSGLARSIHKRTNGNPLFMVNVVDYLEAHELIGAPTVAVDPARAANEVETGVPESLRQMIEKQVERLPHTDQELLEAASVAGLEFSAQALAAGLGGELASAEEACEGLAGRGLFLRPTGIVSLPDGTVTARFAFIHSLYQNVLYHRVPPARRLRLHRRIGERGMAVFGDRVSEIAAELAMHFEQALDYRSAVAQLRLSADNAARRYANREAIDHLTRAFGLAGRLPEADRPGLQMSILEQVGTVRRSMGDMRGAAEDFATLVSMAREERRQDWESRGLFYLGSALFWFDRAGFERAAADAAGLTRRLNDPLLNAHTRGYAAYWSLLLNGWQSASAGAPAAAIDAARRVGDHRLLGQHLVRQAYFLCLQSAYEEGCRTAEEAMREALDAGDGFDYLLSQFFLAWGLLHRGEWGLMRSVVVRGIRMAQDNGHRLWSTLFRIELAWLHALAYDFDSARRLCSESLQDAREAEHAHSQAVSQILLGFAHSGSGETALALPCFDAAGDRAERDTVLMDRSWQMPLGICAGEFWLLVGDTMRARDEADGVLEMAGRSGERTYLALAHRLLARISALSGERGRAATEMQSALASVEGVGAPFAAWQVYATAAELRPPGEAGEWRSRAGIALRRIAASLDSAPELRAAFTTAAPVRALLEITSQP